jgi:lysophospholipase L1-like esterase
MVVTEVQETSGSVVFAGSGWTLNTNVQASGGTEQFTANAGDTCTFTFTGHSVFLVHRETPAWGWFSLTIDGVLQPNIYQSMCGETFIVGAAGQQYRNVQLLAQGLLDGPHTIILTCLAAVVYQPRSGGVGFSVDSFLVCTGARAAWGSTGQYCAIGDSTSNAYGCWQPDALWTNRVARELPKVRRQQVQVQVSTYGDANDSAFCSNWSGTVRLGGQYKMFAYAYANQANFITWMYGANDLRQQSGASNVQDFLRHVRNALNFYQVVFDPSQTKMVVCTPPYINSYYTYDNSTVAAYYNQASAAGSYQSAADGVREIVAQYPTVELADVYYVMAGRDELLFPNKEGDNGLHPNDCGHGVIAECVLEAFSRL